MLDAMENSRVLSDLESDLRRDLKSHLTRLLQQQKTYWQQRGKIKWVTLGSENSKFFHALATIQHRNNSTTSLITPDGIEVCDHATKASLLHEAFKERLGQTEHFDIPNDLLDLLTLQPDLSFLDKPFTKQEIDDIIKDLPSNKSLVLMDSILILLRSSGLLSRMTSMIFANNFTMGLSVCKASTTLLSLLLLKRQVLQLSMTTDPSLC